MGRVLRYSPSPVVVGVGAGVVAVMAAGWLTRGLWGAGPLPGDDTMAHLVRAEFGVRWLAPRGRVDGWQPNFGLGYEQYLFLGPGLCWAVAGVHWLSLGLVSVAGAFKAVVIGSFVTRGDIAFGWVKGHSGDRMNDLVDALAVAAARQ